MEIVAKFEETYAEFAEAVEEAVKMEKNSGSKFVAKLLVNEIRERSRMMWNVDINDAMVSIDRNAVMTRCQKLIRRLEEEFGF